MLRLPARFAAVILCFAPLFRQHTWRHAEVVCIGRSNFGSSALLTLLAKSVNGLGADQS
jgi:GTP-binding protein EngB required for normal cell division